MLVPIDTLIIIVQKSESTREYLKKNHEHEYSVWERFSTKNGTQCAFARAGLKRAFLIDYQARGDELVQQLARGSWGPKAT